MQAYQTPPCPYCGATWNPPGAQTCANCRNQLPPPQAAYAPPGYTPEQPPGQPVAPEQPQYGDPNQGYSVPPGYPQPSAPDYGQPPQAGYGQQPEYGQQAPPGYAPPPGYGYPPPEQAPAYPGYPGYPAASGGYPGFPPPAYSQPGSGAPPPQAGQTFTILGQTFDLPFSLPALPLSGLSGLSLPRVRINLNLARFKPVLYGLAAIAVVWVFLNAVVPALATANLQAANQAVSAAVGHQAKTDAALAQAFTITGKDPMTDVVAAQTVMEARVAGNQAILDQVKADENTISTVDQHLAWLSPLSGSRAASIAAVRQRTHAAMVALQQADQVLTGAVDQERQLDQLFASIAVWKTMQQDLAKHDPASAASVYPDAQQKLQTALTSSAGSDIPPASVAYTKNFQPVLDNTENLAEALQAKDSAGIAKYTAAMQAALRALSFDVPGALAWNLKMFQPLIDGYHAGMRSLKA